MTAAEKKKGISLPVKIIIGLISGTAWAVLSSIMGWSHFTLDWIAPFGDIFINLLKLIAIPLVLFSIISGVSGLSDITKLGRTGLGMMSLYLATTFIAVSVGLVLVNIIQPGKMANDDARLRNRITYELWVNNTTSVDKPKDAFLRGEVPVDDGSVDPYCPRNVVDLGFSHPTFVKELASCFENFAGPLCPALDGGHS